jgi:uncharacterized protein
MATVFVTSAQTFAGKSAVCVGIASRLIHDGYSIGYMKPVSRSVRVAGPGHPIDEDARFIRDTFQLPEPLELLNPVALTPELEESVMAGMAPQDFSRLIRDAFTHVARGREVVLLGGAATMRVGSLVNLSATEISSMLAARELLVVRHSDELVDDVLAARATIGPSMLGVVINAVPRPALEHVRQKVVPYLEGRGIPTFGTLPQDQLLNSISVRELAEALHGSILCAQEAADELVEQLMVGAMSGENALSHFRLKPNKAVITGGDREDVQMAALETSTRCLVLTGDLMPATAVVRRASELGVPIIATPHDTLVAVEHVQHFLGKARFHQYKKIRRFEELMDEWFDFPRMYAQLGLRHG